MHDTDSSAKLSKAKSSQSNKSGDRGEFGSNRHQENNFLHIENLSVMHSQRRSSHRVGPSSNSVRSSTHSLHSARQKGLGSNSKIPSPRGGGGVGDRMRQSSQKLKKRQHNQGTGSLNSNRSRRHSIQSKNSAAERRLNNSNLGSARQSRISIANVEKVDRGESSSSSSSSANRRSQNSALSSISQALDAISRSMQQSQRSKKIRKFQEEMSAKEQELLEVQFQPQFSLNEKNVYHEVKSYVKRQEKPEQMSRVQQIEQKARKRELQRAVSVLQMPVENRTENQYKQIIPFFKKIDLLDKMNLKDKFVTNVLGRLSIEEMQKDDVVCEQGEHGDKFYIILEGKVRILINNQDKMKKVKQLTKMSYVNRMHALEKMELEEEKKKQSASNNAKSRKTATPAENLTQQDKQLAGGISPQNGPKNTLQLQTKSPQGVGLSPRFTQNLIKLKQLQKEDETVKKQSNQKRNEDSDGKKSENNASELLDDGLSSSDDGYFESFVRTEVAELKEGSSFGQLALQKPNSKRQSTVICSQKCIFAVMHRTDYKATLDKIMEMRQDEKIAFLRQNPLFKQWSRTMLVNSLDIIHEETCTRGKELVTEGNASQYFYLVLDGEVSVSKSVRKPHSSDEDKSLAYLKRERRLIQESLYEIERGSDEQTEALIHEIEGDDAGILGGGPNWKGYDITSHQMQTRLANKRLQLKKVALRSRLAAADQALILAQSRKNCLILQHAFFCLKRGQIFGEESLLFQGLEARYTVRVVSETATVYMINEAEFNRRVRSQIQSMKQLMYLTQGKAQQIQRIMQQNGTWALTDPVFGEFYKMLFFQFEENVQNNQENSLKQAENKSKVEEKQGDKKEVQKEESKPKENETNLASLLIDTDHNKKILEEITAFDSYFAVKESKKERKTIEDHIAIQLEKRLKIIRTKVEDLDQIKGATDITPLNQAYLPQYASKNRYVEIQKIVCPNPLKNQKPYHIFGGKTVEEIMNVQYDMVKAQSVTKQFTQKQIKGGNENKISQQSSSQKPKSQLEAIKGFLIDQNEANLRNTMHEVVNGFPKVRTQLDIHFRNKKIAEDAYKKDGPSLVTLHQLLSSAPKEHLEVFEKELASQLSEARDPLQLIRILKRKIAIQDRANADKNIQVLNEMLKREPLCQFVLLSKKTYENTNIVKKYEEFEKKRGNEEELYKHDKDYQIEKVVKSNVLPRQKVGLQKPTFFKNYLQRMNTENGRNKSEMQSRNRAQASDSGFYLGTGNNTAYNAPHFNSFNLTSSNLRQQNNPAHTRQNENNHLQITEVNSETNHQHHQISMQDASILIADHIVDIESQKNLEIQNSHFQINQENSSRLANNGGKQFQKAQHFQRLSREQRPQSQTKTHILGSEDQNGSVFMGRQTNAGSSLTQYLDTSYLGGSQINVPAAAKHRNVHMSSNIDSEENPYKSYSTTQQNFNKNASFTQLKPQNQDQKIFNRSRLMTQEITVQRPQSQLTGNPRYIKNKSRQNVLQNLSQNVSHGGTQQNPADLTVFSATTHFNKLQNLNLYQSNLVQRKVDTAYQIKRPGSLQQTYRQEGQSNQTYKRRRPQKQEMNKNGGEILKIDNTMSYSRAGRSINRQMKVL